MPFHPEFDVLNRIYLEMWDALGAVLRESTALDAAPSKATGLRFLAERIGTARDAKLADGDQRFALAEPQFPHHGIEGEYFQLVEASVTGWWAEIKENEHLSPRAREQTLSDFKAVHEALRRFPSAEPRTWRDASRRLRTTLLERADWAAGRAFDTERERRRALERLPADGYLI